MQQLKVSKLSPDAVLPQKAYDCDSTYDLTASRITTELNEVGELLIVYHTDLCIEIPKGYWGMIIPRASIAKKPLAQVNSVCAISSGYRGEIYVKFRCTVPAVVPSVYKEGERFAQLIILPSPEIEVVEGPLGEGERGTNGDGSTGNKAFNDKIDESAVAPMQQEDSVIEAKDDTTSAEPVVSEQAAEPTNDSEEVQ